MSDQTKQPPRSAPKRGTAKYKGKPSGGHRHKGGPRKDAPKGSGKSRPPQGDRGRASEPVPGLALRELAVDLLAAVLHDGRPFDEAWAATLKKPAYQALEARDRAMARSIAANALRYARPLEEVLANFIDKPLPAKQSRVFAILLSTAAQLLLLKTPPHAAINLAVDQTQKNKKSAHLSKFVNAVLRRVSERGAELLAGLDLVRTAYPDWMWQRWENAYGDETTRAIAAACLNEAALDISLKDSADRTRWAKDIGASELATGSLRYDKGGRTDELPGFSEGAWWVQDAAAALPVQLLGDIAGKTVADICAAPGGKTAQLAAAGATVTAVDISAGRLRRVRENLERLGLSAELVEADANEWQPEQSFDAILLDAPCSATGTIRRHPDILQLKQPSDIVVLSELQKRVLDHVAKFVAPGGMLVYCTCSLEPEEGDAQIEAFLQANPDFERVPIAPGEAGIEPEWLTANGDLRTLPCHSPEVVEPAAGLASKDGGSKTSSSEGRTGMDGFFACRLVKRS